MKKNLLHFFMILIFISVILLTGNNIFSNDYDSYDPAKELHQAIQENNLPLIEELVEYFFECSEFKEADLIFINDLLTACNQSVTIVDEDNLTILEIAHIIHALDNLLENKYFIFIQLHEALQQNNLKKIKDISQLITILEDITDNELLQINHALRQINLSITTMHEDYLNYFERAQIIDIIYSHQDHINFYYNNNILTVELIKK